MTDQRRVEIFSAGCPACGRTAALAGHCRDRGPDEAALKAAGIGVPLP